VKTDRTPPQEGRLGFAEARVSPCLTCSRSPCCSYLPLTSFAASTYMDLDHAVYLANFERIELGLALDGTWSVHYRHPCRYLDPDDRSCTVHGTPDQPHICSQYSAHTCWYRPALSDDGDGRFLRIDRRRLELLLENVRFDEQRQIVSVPEWDDLHEAFAGIPIEHDHDWDRPREAAGNGQVRAEWRTDLRFGEHALKTPCEGCHAWCCELLAFRYPQPTTTSGVDHLRFALGFPGVTAGITGDDWSLLVETRCRHFANRRCSIFGEPERPLRCVNYDAWNCTYKRNLGPNPPAEFARVRYEDFDLLAGTFVFDDNGRATHVPGGEEIATALPQV
jgi:hypothetical protein